MRSFPNLCSNTDWIVRDALGRSKFVASSDGFSIESSAADSKLSNVLLAHLNIEIEHANLREVEPIAHVVGKTVHVKGAGPESLEGGRIDRTPRPSQADLFR